MTRALVLLWLVLGVLIFPTWGAGADLAPTSVCRPGSGTEMRCLHNYVRLQYGAPTVAPDPSMTGAARAKLNDILLCQVFSHDPCGKGAFLYLSPLHLMTWGENIALGMKIRPTFEAWLSSPGHRTNILNPQFRMYGAAYNASPRLWVVDFGA